MTKSKKEANLIDRDLDSTLVQTYQCSHGHLITEIESKEKAGKMIKGVVLFAVFAIAVTASVYPKR